MELGLVVDHNLNLLACLCIQGVAHCGILGCNVLRERYILAAGCGFSALIEVSQLLSLRGTDVDDVIMNTLGAVLGFGLYKLWDRLTGSRFRQQEAARELPLLILAIFLGRFLLFHRMGLIAVFYGV